MDPISAASVLSSTPLDPSAATGSASMVVQQGNGNSFAFHLPQPVTTSVEPSAVSPAQSYVSGSEPTTYGGLVQDMIRQTNQMDAVAGAKVRDVLMGGPTTVNDAMVSVEESSVAFKLLSQVRNQVVSSYKEIMGMQV